MKAYCNLLTNQQVSFFESCQNVATRVFPIWCNNCQSYIIHSKHISQHAMTRLLMLCVQNDAMFRRDGAANPFLWLWHLAAADESCSARQFLIMTVDVLSSRSLLTGLYVIRMQIVSFFCLSSLDVEVLEHQTSWLGECVGGQAVMLFFNTIAQKLQNASSVWYKVDAHIFFIWRHR